jgi:hypothetical protein
MFGYLSHLTYKWKNKSQPNIILPHQLNYSIAKPFKFDYSEKISNPINPSHGLITNPFAFRFDNLRKRVVWQYDQQNPTDHTFDNLGKSLYVESPIGCEMYIRMTVRVTFRNHSGYCSDHESDDEPISEDVKHFDMYYTVPGELLNDDEELAEEHYDANGLIIKSADTKNWFTDWYLPLFDHGNGNCGYADVYTPIKLLYVEYNIISEYNLR